MKSLFGPFIPGASLASGFLCLLLVLPASGQMHHAPARTVEVTGEGLVRADPDRATVQFGVITWAEDPEVAREETAEAAARALNALRGLGIPDEQIQLQVLRLQPRYEYDEETNSRKRVGYEAVRRVEVILDTLDELPDVIARIVEEGANELNGIQYGLQDASREQVRNEALREAARQAQEKAQLLSETLGAELGPLQHIAEASYSGPQPFEYRDVQRMAEAAVASQAVPDAFAAGQVEVQAQVRVVFELEQ